MSSGSLEWIFGYEGNISRAYGPGVMTGFFSGRPPVWKVVRLALLSPETPDEVSRVASTSIWTREETCVIREDLGYTV